MELFLREFLIQKCDHKADLLTFVIALFFIRQTYRELSDTNSVPLKGEE